MCLQSRNIIKFNFVKTLIFQLCKLISPHDKPKENVIPGSMGHLSINVVTIDIVASIFSKVDSDS